MSSLYEALFNNYLTQGSTVIKNIITSEVRGGGIDSVIIGFISFNEGGTVSVKGSIKTDRSYGGYIYLSPISSTSNSTDLDKNNIYRATTTNTTYTNFSGAMTVAPQNYYIHLCSNQSSTTAFCNSLQITYNMVKTNSMIKSIQRGTLNVSSTSAQTQIINISSVNPSKSIVLVDSLDFVGTQSSTTNSNYDTFKSTGGYLGSNQITVYPTTFRAGGGTTPYSFNLVWQVIEFY